MKKIFIISTALLMSTLHAGAQQFDGSIEATGIKVTDTETSVKLEMLLLVNDDAVTKCQSIAVIPTLAGNGHSADFPYVLVNGRKAKNIYKRREKFGFTELRANPPASVINMERKPTGRREVVYEAEIPGGAWTNGARLKLGLMIFSCAGERQYYVLDTSAETTAVTAPAIAVPETPEAPPASAGQRSFEGCAYLDFPVDSHTIILNYGGNAREMAGISRMFDNIKNTPGAKITRLDITGYASPENRYSHNEKLSYDRTLALAQYLQTCYNISFSIMDVASVAEDWVKLRELVQASDIVRKREILQIIDGADNPDVKESKLRRLADGGPWKTMTDTMFPQLRRAEYTVYYTVE